MGQTLTCRSARGRAKGTLAYGYEWLRDGVSSGVRTSSYAVLPADVGSQIACVVTVTGTYGHTEATIISVEISEPPKSPPSKTLDGPENPTGSGDHGSTANATSDGDTET